MTNRLGFTDLLATAEGREKEFNWEEATESYDNALRIVSDDSLERAGILDKRGHALYELAMQSENHETFLRRIREATRSYEKASLLFKTQEKQAKALRASASNAFLGYWETSSPTGKRIALKEATRLAKESFHSFEATNDHIGFGEAFTQLSIAFILRYFYEPSHQTREDTYRQGLEQGERAISHLKDAQNPGLLSKAYLHTAAFVMMLALEITEQNDPNNIPNLDKAKRYWKEARRLDQESSALDLVGLLWGLDFSDFPGIDKDLERLQEILRKARQTRDHLLIGLALDWLSHNIGHKAHIAATTLQESTDLTKDAYKYAEEANAQYLPLGFLSTRHGLFWVSSPEAETCQVLSLYETGAEERRDLLLRSTKATADHLRLAKRSGQVDCVKDAHYVAVKAFLLFSRTSNAPDEKAKALKTALEHSHESIRLTESMGNPRYSMFLDLSYLADIKSELAETFQKVDDKARLLEEAIEVKEKALALLLLDKPYREALEGMEYYWKIDGRIRNEQANILVKLFRITNDKSWMKRAATTFSNAAQSYRELGQPNQVGDCFWRSAQAWDELEDYERAIEDYREAADNYRKAAEAILPLKNFYLQNASLAEIWSNIEEARRQHKIGEHSLAGDSYRKVADIHRINDKTSYLSPNFVALAKLELALDRSRKELSQDALDCFKEASRLFSESRISIEAHTADLSDSKEAEEAIAMIQTSRLRERYCTTRAELEEAKVLNMRGEHKASSEKYGRAIDALQRLQRDFQSELDRTETNLIIALARAFQMMARAEAEASPRLYRTASELFEQAKESLQSETEKRLVLGHSRYCLALEAAARFLDTVRDTDYRNAIQRLSIATNYYTTAGFHNASEYTKATKRLLEAHMYISRANKEPDQGKRAHIQNAVEALLRTSADLFGEAGYTGRRDQTLKLLENVREEKELAISLDDTLASHSLIPDAHLTHSVLAREGAFDHDRFLGPYLVANMFSSPQSPKIGESLGLRIEISNAGMRPAHLVRVEKLIPEGFDLLKKPEEILLEQRHLILKGKRLDPLKTEELNLTLKANVRGPCAVKPRIFYSDETGRSLLHEPEGLEIIVQDPASGLVQGPSRMEDSLNSPVMVFLINSFVEDYMRKRFSLEHSGWRGLPEIVKSLKIPKSQVYGDPRYNHTFGKPLERLVKAGVAEFRIFPGSRGRGGNIVKVRLSYEKEPVKRYVDTTALTIPRLN